MFDPACFYGHHEFDLAIAGMFGGFTRQFYDAYHSIIPKPDGFEQRHKLYLLFHYLNHWYDLLNSSSSSLLILSFFSGTILAHLIALRQSVV